MKDIMEQVKIQLLDFDDKKRETWERECKPYAAHIELTPKCNFKCIHCYLQNQHFDEQLSYDTIIEILDILHEKGILFLTLTGGEIFTRKDFLQIYMYAKKKGFLIELFTNGMLIDDELIKMLKTYPPLLVDISIYGACEDTYKKVTGCPNAFEKVIKNCKKLIDSNIRVLLKSPILRETMAEINEMQAIADKLGIPIAFSFEICATVEGDVSTKNHQLGMKDILKYEFDNSLGEISQEIKSPRREENHGEMRYLLFGCKIGKNSFVIDYNGNMCPCMKFKHKGLKLTKNNFDEIWKNFGKYQELYMSDNCKCSKCKYIDYCEICSAEMDFLYGNPECRQEADCIPAKARYLFFSEHMSSEEVLDTIS